MDYGYFIATVFSGFFAIMNPVGNTPVFLCLAGDYEDRHQRQIACLATLTAFVIIAASVFLGSYIFQVFHITVDAFRIFGGLLVVWVGFDLIHASSSPAHSGTGEDATDMTSRSIAVSPLAIPILAGPGTISTAIQSAFGNRGDLRSAVCNYLLLFRRCRTAGPRARCQPHGNGLQTDGHDHRSDRDADGRRGRGGRRQNVRSMKSGCMMVQPPSPIVSARWRIWLLESGTAYT